MTKDDYQMGVAINEDSDQAKCARYLTEAFPTAPKQEMAAIIDDCEMGLRQMGFGGTRCRLDAVSSRKEKRR